MFIAFYKLLCKVRSAATYDSLMGIHNINFEMVLVSLTLILSP